MDGESTIALAKPTVYGDEKRTLKINVIEVKKNVANKRLPSPKSKYLARLGTTSAKLADIITPSTAPVETIRAIATVTTATAQQAKGTGLVFSYTGVTATISANIVTFPIVTGTFLGEVFYEAPVTASISATIATQSASIITRGLRVETSGIGDSFLLNPEFIDEPFAVASTLNSPVTATFTATILAGAVVKIDITNKGFGYPSGTYAMNFSGGGSTTTASANAVAQSGYIQSVSIDNGGDGYSSAPSVTLFGPAKSLEKTGTFFVDLGIKGQDTTANALIFPDPDKTDTPPLPSKPAGTIAWAYDGVWKIILTSAGYGYQNAITVGFNEIYGYMPIVSYGKDASAEEARSYGIAQSKTVGGGTTNIINDFKKVVVTFSDSLSRIDSGSLRFNATAIQNKDFMEGGLVLKWLKNGWPSKAQFTAMRVSGTISKDGLSLENFPGFTSAVAQELSFTKLAGRLFSLGTIVSGSIYDPIQVYAPPIAESPQLQLERRKQAELIQKQLSALKQQKNTTGGYGAFGSGSAAYNFGLSTGSIQQRLDPTGFFESQLQNALQKTKLSREATFDLTGAPPYDVLTKNNRRLVGRILGSIESYWIDVIGKKTEISPYNLPRPNHAIYAGKKAKFAVVPSNRSFVPTRYAVVEIECPKEEGSFITISFSEDTPARRLGNFDKDANTVGNLGVYSETMGGRFSPILRVLDAGSGYSTSYFGSYDLVELGSIKPGEVLFETSSTIETIFPETLSNGFVDTDFSKDATISTGPGTYATEYFLDSGGVGYFGESVNVGFKTSSTLGHVKSVSLTNTPKNYLNGEYKCEVAPPPSGQTAIVSLVVKDGVFDAAVIDGGAGYTSAPIITAPTPNFVSGQLVSIKTVTAPQGYSTNRNFYLTVPTSSTTNGNAVAFFSIDDNGVLTTTIENAGFGYTADIACTALDPDLRLASGYIQSLAITNSPEGYILGKSYDLTIQASPQAGGDALARLVKTSNTQYTIEVIKQGAGYTSAPIVTAPGFDAPNNTIFAVSASNLGLGYAPGNYETNVTTAPNGKKTAIISFTKTETGDAFFSVTDPGEGYLIAPTVSVVTPAGNVIQSVTIVCGGSYYNSDNVSPKIIDFNGVGASFDAPNIEGGQITSLAMLEKGYGYGNQPQVVFNKPEAPARNLLDLNQLQGDFNITTASANAILATANQRDILLEVYETDGTNEQVVVQATVNLAKRVLE
jgi:hypothetical protein